MLTFVDQYLHGESMRIAIQFFIVIVNGCDNNPVDSTF